MGGRTQASFAHVSTWDAVCRELAGTDAGSDVTRMLVGRGRRGPSFPVFWDATPVSTDPMTSFPVSCVIPDPVFPAGCHAVRWAEP